MCTEPSWLAELLPQDLWQRVVQHGLQQLPDEAPTAWPYGSHTARLRLLVQLLAWCSTLRAAAAAASQAVFAYAWLDVRKRPPPREQYPGLWYIDAPDPRSRPCLSPLLARLCTGIGHLQAGADLLASPQAAAFLEATNTRSVGIALGGGPDQSREPPWRPQPGLESSS